MDESRLRSLGADVESKVDLPDFGAVAERGARLRRRRTVATGAVAALAVAVTAFTLTRTFDTNRSQEPIHQPAPTIDPEAARRVLSDPDAQVDPDVSRVDGAGAMLALVVVRDRTFGGSAGPCSPASQRSALRWTARRGGTRAWVERVRRVEPVPGGFVVAAVPRPCRSDDPADARAYLVDANGVPRGIIWGRGAERVCATRPADVRCHFDVPSRHASFTAAVRLPAGAVPLRTKAAGLRWARSSDSRRLYWSADGRTWRHRDTTLPAGAIVSASAAGRWGVLAGDTSVEFTSDGGATWRRRDLTSALRTVRIGDVDWTVTPAGVLLGVTQLVGRGDVLFRSTDATWSRFVETGVRTAFGLVRPVAVGGAVYVVDDQRWAVSTDGGATWRRTPPLP